MDIKKVVCAINIVTGIIFIFTNANEIPIANASILTLNDKYNIFNSERELYFLFFGGYYNGF